MAPLADSDGLQELLSGALAENRAPGGAVGLLIGGERVTAHAGVADVDTGEEIRPDTRFSIASVTKPMVATVIAGLIDEGRCSFDDPIASLIPELAGSKWAARATVRQLLANTSGVPLSIQTEFLAEGDSDDALAKNVAAIGRTAAIAEPGEIFSYNNGGWSVLGRLVETLVGGTWEQAMTERLFRPAGLSTAGFAHEPVAEPRAMGHAAGGDGGFVSSPMWSSRPVGPAGGSVIATVDDLLTFAAMHLAGNPVLDALRTPHADVGIAGLVDRWCLGWAQFDWGDTTAWGWDGVASGQRAILRIVPETGAAYALIVNGATGRAVNRSLLAELAPRLGGPGCVSPPIPLTPVDGAAGELSRFEGKYCWPDREIVVEAGDGLLRHSQFGQTVELAPIDSRTFLADASDSDSPTVSFGAFDDDERPGVIYSMIWALPRVDSRS